MPVEAEVPALVLVDTGGVDTAGVVRLVVDTAVSPAMAAGVDAAAVVVPVTAAAAAALDGTTAGVEPFLTS